MKRRSVPVLFIVLLVAGLAVWVVSTGWAQQDEQPDPIRRVTLKDGRVLQGQVTRTDEGVQVDTGLAVQTFTEDEIESITAVRTPKDAYIEKVNAIDTDDPTALYELSRWIWTDHSGNLELLQRAREHLQTAIENKSDYTRAKLLLRQINAKIKILEDGRKPVQPVGNGEAIRQSDLVSQRDIYWIRLKELRPDDRVRIRYENDALKRYIEAMRGRERDNWDRPQKERRFLRMSRVRQVQEILDNMPRNTDLLKDIHIESDPRFMLDFRTKVWPILRQSCARSNCHGGAKPIGGLKLFVSGASNERVDYTNFVILSGLVLPDGKKLINRQDVDRSLILQYGLNEKVARTALRHPVDIEPLFANTRAAPYRTVEQWIRSLKGPIHPDYHLEYKPPYGMKLETSGTTVMPWERE